MAKRVSKKEHKEAWGGLFIPAGLFIGLGLGFLYGKIVEGIFIGLGVGFALFAILSLFNRKK